MADYNDEFYRLVQQGYGSSVGAMSGDGTSAYVDHEKNLSKRRYHSQFSTSFASHHHSSLVSGKVRLLPADQPKEVYEEKKEGIQRAEGIISSDRGRATQV